MSIHEVGSFPIGVINRSSSDALSISLPLLRQFERTLTGPFGLGSLLSDLQAQFSASLSLQLQLQRSLVPIFGLKARLNASLSIARQLQALLKLQITLSLSLELPSIGISVSLSASIALAAQLQIRVSGIGSLLNISLKLKLDALNFFASLAGHLSAGPVVLLSMTGDALTTNGNELQNLFSSGVGGISSGDTVYGVFLLTKSPSAWIAMQATIKTS